MKTASLPPLRIDSTTRAAAELVLHEGETLSGFVLDAVQQNINRREAQRAFVARGLQARNDAHLTGNYVSADDVLARLDSALAGARKRADKHPR